ncbi:hypothetical protein PM082_010806 [Marasmius tenuissimus]|nr:hypothetical protein PM082_010806 [Marasmius tenuissimus]
MSLDELEHDRERCRATFKKNIQTRKNVLRGFAGALVMAGISLYVVKRVLDNRRKADLEIYRSLQRSEAKKDSAASTPSGTSSS